MQKQNQIEEEVLDLGKLLHALLRRLPVILLVTVLAAILGFCYSKFYLPLQYQSSVYMYVQSGAKSDENASISQGELQAAQSLVSTYIVILKNNVVVNEVAVRLAEECDPALLAECFSLRQDGSIPTNQLKACVSMAPESNTEVLRISAQTCDPEVSAAICDLYAEIAPSYLIRIVGAGSVEVIGAADIPTSPSAPNIPKLTLLFAAIGFLLSVAAIAVRCFFDRTIKDEQDLAAFGASYLGEIPEIVPEGKQKRRRRKAKNAENEPSLVLNDALPFYVKESYRALRTNLMFALSTKEQNSVVISSANPSEGKSTTAANLAMTLALMDAKVLLIDGDLRRPVQHRNLSLANKCGLSEVLSNMKPFSKAVQRNVTKNLDVLTSGACPPNPAELLASQNMQKLLKELQESYDYVIIDAPPINLVSDALGITPHTAGMILITLHHSTTREDVERAMQNLKLTSAHVLGLVLNGKERRSSGYGYGYRKYDSYHQYAAADQNNG